MMLRTLRAYCVDNVVFVPLEAGGLQHIYCMLFDLQTGDWRKTNFFLGDSPITEFQVTPFHAIMYPTLPIVLRRFVKD